MYSSETIRALSRLVSQSSSRPAIGRRRRVVLVERHSIYRQHIPYILLSRALVRHHEAEPVLFRIDSKVARSRLPRFLQRLKTQRGPQDSINRLFKACGLRRTVDINDRAERYLTQASQITEREIVGLTPRDLERYELAGVLIGDLLYDDFLSLGRTSIDTNSSEFFAHCVSFIATFLAWQSFFATHDVMAVVANHVYRQGVPARIANHLGVKTYEAGLHRVARISTENPPLSESARFREIFGALEKREQQEALSLADRILEEFKSGSRVDHTNWHLPARRPNSADLSALESHEGKKVMLALHCLSDSPHVFGHSLFPDYATWIESTVRGVKDSDVLIVLKPHPACPDIEAIQNLVAEYSNYIVVDAKNPLRDLASAGVSLVVTFFGNISFEAALLGLEVLNLTHRNPHSNYEFGAVPSSESEYHQRIMRPSSSRVKYQVDELREYLYMSRLHWDHNLFFRNTNEVVADAEKATNPAEWLTRKFIEESQTKKLNELEESLLAFVAGKEQRFQRAE